MNNFVMFPIIIVLLSGLALQLNGIAEKTTSKTISFAYDAGEAIDCALLGIPIEECAPELLQSPEEFTEYLSDVKNLSAQLADIGADVAPIMHLRLQRASSFKLSYQNNEFVFRLDSIEIGEDRAEFIVVNLEDITAVNRIPLSTTEELGIDVDEDGAADVKISIRSLQYDNADLRIEILRGEVTPLDVSVLLFLLVTAVFTYLFFAEKEGE